MISNIKTRFNIQPPWSRCGRAQEAGSPAGAELLKGVLSQQEGPEWLGFVSSLPRRL